MSADADDCAIEMWPGGPPFPDLVPKITQAAVDELARSGHDVATEYYAKWAIAGNAYLDQAKVHQIFGPWRGGLLQQQQKGKLHYVYVAHADPSVSQANFAFAIGHLEQGHDGKPHVVFDVLRVWRPQDFPGRVVNYMQIEDEILEYLLDFRLSTLTFDQYSSTQTIQQLQWRVQEMGLRPMPSISELTATASHNFVSAELFKTAMSSGLIHAPPHELARDELLHLVRDGTRIGHPKTGSITTDDLADAMINVVWLLLRDHDQAVFGALSAARMRASGRQVLLSSDPIADLSQWSRGRPRETRNNPARGIRRNRS